MGEKCSRVGDFFPNLIVFELKLQVIPRALGKTPSPLPYKVHITQTLCRYVDVITINKDMNSGDFYLASIASSNLVDITSSWLVEHPSALGSFDKMMEEAKGKKIVVFLDYDGTLSPIVNDPDLAFMSDEMRVALSEVVRYFPTAVISGRSRDKVKGFVQLSNVYYAGSHGMDIMITKQASELDESDMLFQPAKAFLPAIQEIRVVMEEIARNIEGTTVEDNRFCISVHYRNIVREEDYNILEENVKAVIKNYPEFQVTRGKKVLEIRPSIEWNKGHALEYLLDVLGFSDSGEVFPLYIGDDQTDEDAFKVIETRGQGFPIIVSSTPKDTKATYSLHDPSEVSSFLSRLARWRKALW